MMIEIVEDFWVDPELVSAIKAAGPKRCTLWTMGQGALDGHTLDYAAEEVVEAVNDAREEDGDDD